MARQTAAEKAFKAAQAAIAQAAKSGATELRLFGAEFSALDRLPEEIAGLTGLTYLDLMFSKVSDLEPLRGLTGLTRLDLSDTKVSDLEPLRGLTGLTELALLGTGVSDLEPLRGLTGLTELSLSGTGVSDLEPLRGLTGLTRLALIDTKVSDLEPLRGLTGLTVLALPGSGVSDLEPLRGLTRLTVLSLSGTKVSNLELLRGLTGLTVLYLSGTGVSDLEPLRGMTGLTWLDLSGTEVSRLELQAALRGKTGLIPPEDARKRSLRSGVALTDCFAARKDARIAQIAAIADERDRTIALFEELGLEWRAEKGDRSSQTAPTVPARRPAPMEIEVSDNLIELTGQAALPQADANTRAAAGWAALKRQRNDFEATFNLHNCRPLPQILASFDREMGEAYDPARTIGIGSQGRRLKAQAESRTLCQQLPDGAEEDLKALIAAVELYVGRFPDWVAYRDEGDPDDTSPEAVRSAEADFAEIESVLNSTPEATGEVKAEYHGLVAEGTTADAGEVEARGLVASTNEFARALAEKGMADAERQKQNRRAAKLGGDFYDKLVVGPTYGLAMHVMQRVEGPARRLAKRFPAKLGWLEAWFDGMFGPKKN